LNAFWSGLQSNRKGGSPDNETLLKMKFPRKSFVTHKKFQYGFILCLGVFGGLLALLDSWIHAYISRQDPDKMMSVHSIAMVSGVVLLIFVPIVLAVLIFTNRIAGPLLRLQKHMELAGKGEIPPNFKFRDKDFFCDLEGPYNLILERLRNAERP